MNPGLSGLRERSRRLVPRWLVTLSERTPLRVKLISAVLALVVLALLVFSVSSVYLMRDYLYQQDDNQVRSTALSVFDQIRRRTIGRELPLGSQMYGQWIRPDGAVVQSIRDFTRTFPQLPPPTPDQVTELGEREKFYTVRELGGTRDSWRVLAWDLGDNGLLTVAIPLQQTNKIIRKLIFFDLLLGGAVVILLAIVGAGIVRASLKPLDEIEETAQSIAEGNLSQRVPERDPRTEVGRLSRSLNGMLGQLEAAFQAQAASESQARGSEERMRRFVADASHELRTPLTAIRGFAEFYRQGAGRSPAETEKLFGRIEGAAERMGLLVEDLLMLARLDQQRPMARRPVDLLALAADAVQETRMTAPDRDIELSLDGEMAFQVMGDEQRLRQVLGNLLSNAVLHTPAGTPVEVRLSPGALFGHEAVVIDVIDQGPGLAPEVAERVFERFYRADAARSQGGTGLGLSIVAALVAAHNGTVEVQSTPGKGATFRVTLPQDA